MTACEILKHLLETDEIDPRSLLHKVAQADADAKASGEVNFDTVLTATEFYSRTHKYKNSNQPIRVRKNGKVKTWVRQPGKFRVPVKYGLYDYFYIDNDNASEWSTKPL